MLLFSGIHRQEQSMNPILTFALSESHQADLRRAADRRGLLARATSAAGKSAKRESRSDREHDAQHHEMQQRQGDLRRSGVECA